MILLVVDTQELITNTGLYHFDVFVSHVKDLIKTARENHIEVIYVRHDDGAGRELTKGTAGFEIYEEFEPDKVCVRPSRVIKRVFHNISSYAA